VYVKVCSLAPHALLEHRFLHAFDSDPIKDTILSHKVGPFLGSKDRT
jgi:hypothetical protein